MFGIGKKCFFCRKKAVSPRCYVADTGKQVSVCVHCVPYAERRAFRKC